ncbi:hypothetical protein D3C78_1451740 [compost metagenome]
MTTPACGSNDVQISGMNRPFGAFFRKGPGRCYLNRTRSCPITTTAIAMGRQAACINVLQIFVFLLRAQARGWPTMQRSYAESSEPASQCANIRPKEPRHDCTFAEPGPPASSALRFPALAAIHHAVVHDRDRGAAHGQPSAGPALLPMVHRRPVIRAGRGQQRADRARQHAQ